MAFCVGLALVSSLPVLAQQSSPAQPNAPAQTAQLDVPSETVPAVTQNPAHAPAPSVAGQPALTEQNPQVAPAPASAGPAPAAEIPPAQDQPVVGQAGAASAAVPLPGEMTEDELKRMLVGKQLFLRGGYLDNCLSFNESGMLIGHSPQGSFTLNQIQVDRVHLTKHKVELEGTRFGLHFTGALAYEDPSTAVEPLRITPKKKVVRITIDREQVLVRKAKKDAKSKEKEQKGKPSAPAQTPLLLATAAPPASETMPGPHSPLEATEPSEADQLKAEIAAAPTTERPADPASVTTTFSPVHATNVLRGAIDRIFANGIDDRLIAAMPDFWKHYYQAMAEKADYRPKDPTVLRQNAVDSKARLLTSFQPESNEFAQADAVSGMALYHAVIGPEGKPVEIAVGRPIGFGLDENAVESIRRASFEPAIKDGKPVPVLLDLVVQFHIYSKRTAVASKPEDLSRTSEPILPGPYSLRQQ
jgi:hypothetical protein